jgi:hypothetical protein
MADLTLDQKITDAQAALHKLMTGSMREEVRTGTDLVRYTPADMDKLRGYIADLQSQAITSAARGAIGFIF